MSLNSFPMQNKGAGRGNANQTYVHLIANSISFLSVGKESISVVGVLSGTQLSLKLCIKLIFKLAKKIKIEIITKI